MLIKLESNWRKGTERRVSAGFVSNEFLCEAESTDRVRLLRCMLLSVDWVTVETWASAGGATEMQGGLILCFLVHSRTGDAVWLLRHRFLWSSSNERQAWREVWGEQGVCGGLDVWCVCSGVCEGLDAWCVMQQTSSSVSSGKEVGRRLGLEPRLRGNGSRLKAGLELGLCFGSKLV